MMLVTRATVLVSVAGAGVALSAALLSGAQAPPPAAITSDTAAYCHELSERAHELAALHPTPSPRTIELLIEGRALCARGQIRGGLLRLRQAVRLMTGAAVRPH
ncbi:MAG TPA: hypothetical protein VIZ17_03425 [Acetobacteraceae bacterium]